MSDSPTGARAPASFDPLSEVFAEDPYAVYAQLRALAGLSYYEPYDMWLVSRHEEVSQVLRDTTMVRSLDFQRTEEERQARLRQDNWHDMPYHSRFVQFSMLDSDGPVHDRLRQMVASSFTPAALERLRPKIEALVEERLEHLLGGGEIEFVEDFAAHIPGHVIGRLMGVPAEDCALLRRWSEDIVQFFDLDRSEERKALAEATTERFYRYLKRLADERLRAPRDDLTSALVELRSSGALTEDEFISTCMLIVMAGHGSTVDVLGSGMHCLLRFPDQLRLLRTSPSLLSTAVEEIFRFEPPLPFFHRYAAQETRFGEETFASGSRFGLLYASANRDVAVFERAATFDITRRPNRHRSFGGGAHFCLGIHLARLTLRIVFATLLQRCAEFKLLAAPRYKRGLTTRGPAELRMRLVAR